MPGWKELDDILMGHNGPPPTDRIPASLSPPVAIAPRCDYCNRPKPDGFWARCQNCGYEPDPVFDRRRATKGPGMIPKPAPPDPNPVRPTREAWPEAMILTAAFAVTFCLLASSAQWLDRAISGIVDSRIEAIRDFRNRQEHLHDLQEARLRRLNERHLLDRND